MLIDKTVSILVGNTPEKAVVYQIAERQRDVLSDFYSDVVIGSRTNADVTLVHKYGIDAEDKSFNVFFFHFDPYDIRHQISMDRLEKYLSAFDQVICINKKQQYFCNKRNIKNTLIPHGSDYQVESKENCNKSYNESTIVKPTIALVCDFYGGNVKGEAYFFELARKMSTLLKFVILGKDWPVHEKESKYVEVINVKSYTELKNHFDDVDVLFIGSRYEAGPASFPDAVNSNKYVLATPVGMVLDNFIEGESGFYISFDIRDDTCNLNEIVTRIENNISAKYEFLYLDWHEQIKNIVGVIDESHH